MKNKIFNNAAWIIVMQGVKALLTLVVSMISTRFLGASNYGLINYAVSIVSFVAPLMYLGYNNVLVRELVKYPEKEGETLGSAIVSSLVSGVACIGLVIAFTSIINATEQETILVCSLYSVILIFQGMDLILYWFQAKLMSKYSSIASLCAHIVVAIYKIVILVLSKNVYWFAISNAIEYMIVSLVLIVIYKRLGGQKLKFSFVRVKEMLHSSKFYIIATMMVSVSTYIGRIMLKLLINDTQNGYFSAAVNCAAMLTFVYVAIIDSFRPEVVKYKDKDNAKYVGLCKTMYNIIIYSSTIQSLLFCFLAPLIVKIVCGAGYTDSIVLLQVVVWYMPFSCIASARNVWILAEGKEKYLSIINLISAIVNVVLNYVLIVMFGTLGAALATVLSNAIVTVVVSYMLKPLRENFFITVKALDPRITITLLKNVISKKFKG